MAQRRRFATRAEFAKAPSDKAILRKSFETSIEPGDVQTRTLRFTISTSGVDRDNDVVTAGGWDLKNYLKSPVVLWAHQYDQLPVGKATNVRVDGDRLKADVEFVDPETYPFAETVFRMLKGGFLGGTSVGFRPKTFKFNEKRQGFDFAEQELLEFSVVPIPANPDALLDARAAGVLMDTDFDAIEAWAQKSLASIPDRRIALATDEPLAKAEPWWPDVSLGMLTRKSWDELGDRERHAISLGFAWAKTWPPKKFEDLALHHHDPKTGKVSWRALVHAMGKLLSGTHGIEGLTKEYQAKIYDHLAGHFEAFKATPPPNAPLKAIDEVWVAMVPEARWKELPAPSDGESESDFVSRCMGDEKVGQEFDDQKQRAAVCYAQYRRGKAVKKHMDGCPRGEDCPMKPGMDYCPAGDECPMGKGQKAAATPETKDALLARAIDTLNEALVVFKQVQPEKPKAAEKTAVLPSPDDPTWFVLEETPTPPKKSAVPSEPDALQLGDLSVTEAAEIVAKAVRDALEQERRAVTGELD